MALCAMTYRLAAGQQATVALRRTIEPCAERSNPAPCGAGSKTDLGAKHKSLPKREAFVFGAEGGIRTLVWFPTN